MESCVKDQTSKGKDDAAAKKICGFLEKTKQIGAVQGDYVENKDVPVKEDFKSVGECVKHCIDVLGKTEEQANTFCTKLFEAPDTEDASKSARLIQKYLPSGVQNEDKYFVKAFLLDDTINLNQWGVNADSIPKNIATFIGKPLVLTEAFDHPIVDDMSYTHALQYQDIYRIGTIVDIVKMDKQKDSPYGNSYFAIIEITNPAAKAAFQAETLPLYVSPAIAQMVREEDPTNLKDWLALHLAIVDDPAYTMQKAMITGKCGGDTETCLIRLRQAHIEKFGYGNCGFCVKGKLLSVRKASTPAVVASPTVTTTISGSTMTISAPTAGQTVTVNVENIDTTNIDGSKLAEKITESITENSKVNTSHESEKQQIQQVHMDSNTNPNNLTQRAADVPNTTAPATATTPNTVQATTPQTQPVQKTVEIDFSKSGADRATIVNAENIQFKAENTILKEQKAALEKELETYKSELHGIKENLRRERIAAIVNNVIVDEATKEETIKFFMESKLQPEQVEAIYQSVGGVKKANVQPSTTPNYEPRMPMTRTAKKSDVSEHDYEALFGIGDYIVKDDGGAI